MGDRLINFNAGPSILPVPVLEEAAKNLVEYGNAGMSIMEMSHPSKEFDAIIQDAEARIRSVIGVPAGYQVMFLQGGASLQFSMLPMNLLGAGQTADYINTGVWAKTAIKEAKKVGTINVAASSEDRKFAYIPKPDTFKLTKGAAYVHTTSNNTIYGTQWQSAPSFEAPHVCDMSSDICNRPIDMSKYACIYAGAQKNLGPSGVVVVIMRDDLVARSPETLSAMLSYKNHAAKKSLHNTPPTFAIYIVQLVMKWIEAQGGLKGIEKVNEAKAKAIYDAIDRSGGFYVSTVDKDARSKMNITFRLKGGEELEAAFISEAKKQAKLHGLKGHRDVGGCRASIYNAMPLSGCETLASFMDQFAKKNG